MKTADLDTAALIIQIVCRHFNCTCEDLESRSREMTYVWPRWIAIYLINRHTGLDYAAIGLLFDRERTHIYTLVTKIVAAELATNRKHAAELARLEQAVQRLIRTNSAIGYRLSAIPS